MIILTMFDKKRSHTPINSESMPSETRTITVDPMSSSFVGHETFAISSFTSLKNPAILFAIFLTTVFTPPGILSSNRSAAFKTYPFSCLGLTFLHIYLTRLDIVAISHV